MPEPSAATTGSDFLRATKSAPTGLPVTAGSPQIPIRSSISWNARPISRPKPSIACAASSEAPAYVAPIAQAAPSSAPVLASAIARHSVSETSLRCSKAQSICWPSQSSTTQSVNRRIEPWAAGWVSSASRRRASECSASPARMASVVPNTRQAVGRWRLVSSRSMTSSWSRVKLWTSSTAAAAAVAVAGVPPSAWVAASTSAGLMALPEGAATGVPSASHQPKW